MMIRVMMYSLYTNNNVHVSLLCACFESVLNHKEACARTLHNRICSGLHSSTLLSLQAHNSWRGKLLELGVAVKHVVKLHMLCRHQRVDVLIHTLQVACKSSDLALEVVASGVVRHLGIFRRCAAEHKHAGGPIGMHSDVHHLAMPERVGGLLDVWRFAVWFAVWVCPETQVC